MIVFVLWFLTATFLFFCFTGSAFAQVEITEIMYDLEGSDTNREWVEIYNGGSDDIDLAKWWFVDMASENEKRHKFSPYPKESGDVVIRSNSFAVIVIKPEAFLEDWSGFSGKILDSSFSLQQKYDIGEKLIIRDSEENDIDSVTYDPLWGANGDGNSLQKVNGSWCAGTPTPGVNNVTICADSPDDDPDSSPTDWQGDDNQDTQEASATYSKTMPSWAEEPKISTYAGARKRIVVAGVSTDFTGQSRGADDKLLSYARYIWSFGDGSQGVGKDITHTYYYPGEYIVVLNTASRGYAAMDRVVVKVIPADIVITNVSFDDPSFIEIYNKTSYELDLSQWKLKVGKWKFTIPQDTFIGPKKKIVFPSQVTKLSLKEGNEISFLYPSGDIVTSYDVKKEVPTPLNKVSNNTPITQPASDHVEEKVVIKNTNTENNNPSPYNTVKSEEFSVQNYDGIDEDEEKPIVAIGSGVAKKELIAPNTSNTAQAANVLGGAKPQKKNKEDGLFWGIMGVSLISLIAIYGVLISKEKENSVQTADEVGLYKIIEIED